MYEGLDGFMDGWMDGWIREEKGTVGREVAWE